MEKAMQLIKGIGGKAKKLIMSGNGAKYIIAAVLVVAIAGVIGIRAFAVDTYLTFKKTADSTSNISSVVLEKSVSLTTTDTSYGEEVKSPFYFSLNGDESLKLENINTLWKITDGKAIGTFKGIGTDSAKGVETLNKTSYSNLDDTALDTVDFYIKSAGVIKVSGQPRTKNATGDLTVAGSAANISVISPIEIKLTKSLKASGSSTDSTVEVNGSNGTYSLKDRVDPDEVSFLNFKTNIAFDNLDVKLNNVTQTITQSAASTSVITYDAGTITVPTAMLKAGTSTITIQTLDVSSAEAAYQNNLKASYTFDVVPVLLNYNKIEKGSMTGTASTLYKTDDGYYYVFSENAMKEGKNSFDLSSMSNIAADNPDTYGRITISSTTPVEGSICEVSGTKVTGNVVGIATIAIKGPTAQDNDIELKVVVPYTHYENYEKIITVGDQATINYTGGNKTESTTADDILSITWPTVTAKKAGKTTITSTLKDLSDYGYTNEQIALFKQLYNLDYTQRPSSSFKFTIIDSINMNPESATVNIDESFDVTIYTTSTEEISAKQETITGYENLKGSITIEKDKTVVQNGSIYVHTYHITGKTAGWIYFTVQQNINGDLSTKQCKIEVVSPIRDITLSGNQTIYVGGDGTLKAEFTPASTRITKIEWYSDDETIAKVEMTSENVEGTNQAVASVEAKVTGIKKGNTDIHIKVTTSEGTKDTHITVMVKSKVKSVTLQSNASQKTITGQAGGSFQLLATVTYEDGSTAVNDGVTFEASSFDADQKHEDVVTVDQAGLVTYVKSGQANVKAYIVDNGETYSDSCYFTIEVPITGFDLDNKDVTLKPGDTLSIKALITPANASNQDVTWKSSNESVATITAAEPDSINATITAVEHGSATIICSSAEGQIAMCTVYVTQPVTSVSLGTQDTINIRKGQSIYLYANVLPTNADNKNVTWTSDRPEYCSVDQNGMITGIEPTGENYAVTITVTSVDNPDVFAQCKVNVIQPLNGISLNVTDKISLRTSPKENFYETFGIVVSFNPSDADNKNVTFVSGNTNVATVSETGLVTAVGGGTTIITVTSEEGPTATCTVEVKEYVSSITLDKSEIYLNVGNYALLTATVETTTASDRTVKWISSNSNVVTVDSNGNLYGQGEGNAVITASAADGSGVAATCTVYVVNPAQSIEIQPSTATVQVGDYYQLTAVITPDDATIKEVEWTSSNTSIATVDESGEVYGVSAGKVKITATATDGSGVKGVAWVYVTKPIDITSLKINSSEIYMLTGKQRQLAVRVRPATNTDSYDWYSTDTGIVTVNSNGIITTVGPGTADVVVESTNNGVSSTCTVHSLAINMSSLRLEQYDSNTLDLIGIDSGDTVTWHSSNPRIATVDSSGKVVGRMSGTCNITATTHNKTIYCTVTVFTAKKYN